MTAPSPTPTPPADGQPITIQDGVLQVPERPILPFIEGDGTGPDIWRATSRVLEAAVEKAYGGERKIAWVEVYAGQKCFDLFGTWLADETVEAFRKYLVGIKGPLTTPVGGASARSTWPCARSSTCTSASGRCAGSRACPRPRSTRRT